MVSVAGKQARRPELLAPAGDWEAMKAAVANGADAIYFGLSNFNARHRAVNFSADQLVEVMQYLHAHNVRGYIAFNTLIFSDELPQAVKLAAACAKAGVDSVIVQDLGLAALIHRLAPTLPLHGSTQMTLTDASGIEFVRQFGIQRVILPRELSLDEIGKIRASTSMPVEVFVHGAMCVSYSGQCLTSEAMGGRSANRGQCAQACRLPYDLVVDGQVRDMGDRSYLLSPQDLAAGDLIGRLVEVGAAGFKIEGRLKSAHYVAATTQVYRAALDAAIAHQPFTLSVQQKQDLAQSFSRGFTHGFLDGVDHQALVHARFPKSRGVRIGTVVGRDGAGIKVRLDSPLASRHSFKTPVLRPGDGVVFDQGHPEQDEQGGRIYRVSPVNGSRESGVVLAIGFDVGQVSLEALEIGSIVWKTDDPALRKRLEQSYARTVVAHRVGLTVDMTAVIGQKLSVTMTDDQDHSASAQWDQPLQAAQKFPLTKELVHEQFGRLGQTPFEIAALKLHGQSPDSPADAVMVPKSVLNDLRRQCVDELLRQRAAQQTHAAADEGVLLQMRQELPTSPAPASSAMAAVTPRLTVLVRTMEQLAAVVAWKADQKAVAAGSPARVHMVYCEFEDVRRYPEAVALAKAQGMPIGLATLRIIKPGEDGLLRQVGQSQPNAVLVRNLSGLQFFKQHFPELMLVGDYALNLANELTAGVLLRAGLKRLTPSYDLNWGQLAGLLKRLAPELLEVVIHQQMPMFHMEHCVFAHTLSNGRDSRTCGRPCEKHQVELKDRMGQSHPLVADAGCRNTLFNAAAQSAAEYVTQMRQNGLSCFRVELVRQTAEQVVPLLDRYARVLAGLDDGKCNWRQLRVLNQLGVTRGTLDFR